MMRMWMMGFWLATLLPMAAMLAWVRPVLSTRWREAAWVVRAGLAVAWMAGSAFLLVLPHDDSFTGLDNMTYRQMAHAFLDGRGFHDPDTVLAEVPEALREDFLLHRGPVGRPTRDRVFELADWQSVKVQPFFMPVLPLAAAAQEPMVAAERFVPLVASLCLALILAAGFCAGGGWGILAVLALVMGSAWPAWFLRGFYAEGVGALLVASVVATASIRPLRGGMAWWAGLALGMAVAYHPTLVMLSIPVALGLMLERREWKSGISLVVGGAMGAASFWSLTRWVCQPYGDWTRWAEIQNIISLAPEHQAIAWVLLLILLVSLSALWVGFLSPVRQGIRRLDDRMTPWGWLGICLLPLGLVAGMPGDLGETLRQGASSVWSGIRWPFGCLLLISAGWVCRRQRPLRERFWLAVLCWGAILFWFIKGLETPVGLWSQRRFLPVMLMGIALFAAPLSAGLSHLTSSRWRRWAGVLLLIPAFANLVRWPAAYAVVNEQGSSKWIQSIADEMGPDRRVIFDYYNHSIPYAAGLQHRVLGLGEPSRDHWPEVAAWIEGLAQTQEVWIATSWAPCTLEQGVRLESVFHTEGRFPRVRTKVFFPAVQSHRIVNNHFMRVVPLLPGTVAPQTKQLDDSPVGLRGPWGRTKDTGDGRMARWSRQGSGIIGPVPTPGGKVRIQIECAFMASTPDWKEQSLQILPPWGGEPVRVTVKEGWQTVEAVLPRPSGDIGEPSTGTYSLHVDQTYNPAQYGVMGYRNDLGVQVRQIIIRIESGAPSVSD
jgi:hypothetical protein